ncbi:malto-oligosyltrehalose trehalohydrolase [Nocardioides sp. JQ2195]|uniref:malto-oligosyltrehalose trehalohydrolase n=1 Tax=Nocardioides sp. JQ2195 TaxID=2592334 RepID=UPI00143EA152|nr:malto-oligosyltrehalose trehalohydrolase [Nocardioides sp. JQ2195]QIX27178.1 malto-oligosyltrehalose trehalohydrolase [Nocardioides sp. JQ2195]
MTTRGPFDVWAPRPERVRLLLGDPAQGPVIAMSRGDDGWWTPDEPLPPAADEPSVDYGYLLDDDPDPRPDPRSRRQPAGVHGLSRLERTSWTWTDESWTGRQLAGSVIYELHVGTFTPAGDLDAAIAKLDHLRSIGVDFVELMPVNAFNGTHNWGYDGVGWFAVHEGYGGPDAYRRFVDACHGAGLGVVQDVVHNHLGPSGNYLPLFGPYLKQGSNTWGDLVNLDADGSPEVRRYILDNVRMWLEELHVDALRLDAVHALSDSSTPHLLEEMAVEVAALSAHQRRPLTLIAESDLNDTVLVTPREGGGLGLDAQWSDDFHHALHVALSGETSGYYADFEPLEALAKVCERGFFHDGTWSSFREREHGRPVDVEHMPTWRLVVCNQNHDQVGNRARGDRPAEHLDVDQLACAALLTLAGPFTPMLFMGEEWAASSPFQFFTSHPEPELGRATAEGRIAEFARMGWNPDEVPDPQDPETFRRSVLDWDELATGHHAVVLDCYRRLAELRRKLPALTDPDFTSVSCTVEGRVLTMRRRDVLVVVNFGDSAATLPVDHSALVFATPSGAVLDAGVLSLPRHAGALLLRETTPDRGIDRGLNRASTRASHGHHTGGRLSSMTVTEESAPGRLVDVHGDGDRGVVLLWHGRGADSRPELAQLGATIAQHGVRVVVPDWDCDDPDGGRTALLASLSHARRVAEQIGADPQEIVLVGWSLGGTAALGLVTWLDEPVARVVLLAPGDGPNAIVPFTGEPLPEVFPHGAGRPLVQFVSAVDDDIVSPALVRGLASRLTAAGWATSWTDLEADHWSIAMTRFDEVADRGVPTDDPAALATGRRVAEIIASPPGS